MIKILQTFDKITTYPYITNAFQVCESEMLSKNKCLILMIIPMKTKQNITQKGHIFQITYAGYQQKKVLDQEKQVHY